MWREKQVARGALLGGAENIAYEKTFRKQWKVRAVCCWLGTGV